MNVLDSNSRKIFPKSKDNARRKGAIHLPSNAELEGLTRTPEEVAKFPENIHQSLNPLSTQLMMAQQVKIPKKPKKRRQKAKNQNVDGYALMKQRMGVVESVSVPKTNPVEEFNDVKKTFLEDGPIGFINKDDAPSIITNTFVNENGVSDIMNNRLPASDEFITDSTSIGGFNIPFSQITNTISFQEPRYNALNKTKKIDRSTMRALARNQYLEGYQYNVPLRCPSDIIIYTQPV